METGVNAAGYNCVLTPNGPPRCKSQRDICSLCDGETDSAMTGANIAIDYLANCPEFVDELARLSWKEWPEVYEQRQQTLQHSVKNYRERMNTNRLPLTLVAVRARHGQSLTGLAANCRELMGMVSLKFHDMDTRPDLDPWLGGLLVLPQWRNQGVGTMLMNRATEEARRLDVPQLYLWTHSAEGLYHKLGWQVVERANYFGKEAVVMQIDLRGA
jgi:GNAT superfamily N-acetyltransferase